MDAGKRRPGFPWHLLVIFALLTAGIVAAGVFYYHGYEKQYRTGVEHQLLAIAELKAEDLANWRRERLADASFIFRNPAFSDLVRRTRNQPEEGETRSQLRRWLWLFQSSFAYDRVFLLDARGALWMQATEAPEPVEAHLARDAVETLQSGETRFLDFHRDVPEGPAWLALLVPIFDEQDGHAPLGVVVLRIDPASHLYPFINRWPTPSQTAETLLVRRDGDEVLFLNELRFLKDAALRLRRSLMETQYPSVKAVLGQEGIVNGVDYRGEPVIAAVRAVPESPWFLVARIDVSEVYAPARERLWLVIVLIGALILGAGAALGLAWRQRSAAFYRERAEAAEALRLSEARFRTAIQEAPFPILIHAEDGEVLAISRTWTEITGYSHADIPTINAWTEKAYGDRRHLVREDVEKLYGLTQRKAEGEYAILCRDGSQRIWDFSSMPLPTLPDGRRVVVSMAHDVTDRKQAEGALRQSEVRLLAILDATPFPVALVDVEDNQIEFWSRSALTLFGHTAPTAPEWYQIAYPDPEYRSEVVRRWKPCLEEARRTSQTVNTGEYRVTCQDGSVRICELFATFLGNRLIVTFSDVTERKQAEEALKKNEQELRRKNDELQQFTYTVSHDLKSPLVTIRTFLGYLEADLRGQNAKPVEKDLAYIRGAADRMSRLLDELLELSRVGHQRSPFTEVSLQDVAKEALGLVAGQIATRGAKVQVTEEPVWLHGDRRRLVELFQNLVDNAVKFMGNQAAPLIRIGVEQAEGETVLLVQDNGIGIDPRHRSKLFGLFEKLDPATEGMGMGLALVKRIVEVHGGRIGLESAGPGQGTTVRFTLSGTRRQST
jgi:PAS domain S-box-containing protein